MAAVEAAALAKWRSYSLTFAAPEQRTAKKTRLLMKEVPKRAHCQTLTGNNGFPSTNQQEETLFEFPLNPSRDVSDGHDS